MSWQVGAAQAEALAAALRDAGNRDAAVRLFPETSHLFLHDPVGDFSADATFPERQVRPVILGTLADWLAARLGATH